MMEKEIKLELEKLEAEYDKISKVIETAINNGLNELADQLMKQKDEIGKKISDLDSDEDPEESSEEKEVTIDAPFRSLLLLIEVNKEDVMDETNNIINIDSRSYNIIYSTKI